MNRKRRNVKLICLFKGIKRQSTLPEVGSYVDMLLTVPFSLATASLKAFAEQNIEIKKRYDIEMLNLSDNGDGIIDSVKFDKVFIERILNNNPVAVGFSTYCWNILATIEIIKRLKKIKPDIKIIVGGRYASIEFLKRVPDVDFVIKGEGEIPFVELLRSAFEKKRMKGVAFKSEGRIIDGGSSDIVSNLDLIPSPYICGIIKPNQVNMMLELSRGCVNNCAYCNWNSDKTLRIHSYKRIREELLFAKEERIRHITIIDSAINYKEELLESLSQAVRELGLNRKMKFTYNLRYEIINERQVKYLKDIPAFQILIGLESINPNSLVNVNRRVSDLRKFEYAVSLLKTVCKPSIGVILGLPGDTPEQFKQTIYYLENLNYRQRGSIGAVLISLLQVFPASGIDKDRLKFKIRTFSKGVPYIRSNISWSPGDIVETILWVKDYRRRSRLNIRGIEGDWVIEDLKKTLKR
jgi:radical SAM superfamily enzyme YgiQ (UPF0313 family)